MKSIKTLVLALVLGLAGVAYAANNASTSTPACASAQAECCTTGAACCTGGACCTQ